MEVPAMFDFSSLPTLKTPRLILREIDPEMDLESVYALFADPNVALNTDTGPFTAIEEAGRLVSWFGEIFAQSRGMRWAITHRPDAAALIGTCGYNSWHRWNNCAEIGYDLAHRYWGKGIMTEALVAMIEFGFTEMGLNRIEADVTVGNDRSAALLQKLGFIEEGVLRQRGHWRGAYVDLRFFGLLRADWQPGS